jgi:hypothetical protein
MPTQAAEAVPQERQLVWRVGTVQLPVISL